VSAAYPEGSRERDRWILSHRSNRNVVDPRRPYACLVEEELTNTGDVAQVATVFLTNRECPWRCLMCDLWKNTLIDSVPPGAIPAQIDQALRELGVTEQTGDVGLSAPTFPPRVSQIKLYNSGSFFDPRAIPPEDHPDIATRLSPFKRVIVECHPALVGDAALQFQDRLSGQFEIAIGLETAHPDVLPRLNKRITLEQFANAATFLRQHEIALRVFVLVKPPFVDESEALHWAKRSIDFAFDCGATVVSLIPTRFGNGALEALSQRREFSPPELVTLEAAADYGVGLQRGRVFADLWDLEKFSQCPVCFSERRRRLERMNLTQRTEPPATCARCAQASPVISPNRHAH
jgi:archaeosine synthase beta-subunit